MSYKLRTDAREFWDKWIDPSTNGATSGGVNGLVHSIIVTSEAQRDHLILEMRKLHPAASIHSTDRTFDVGGSLPGSTAYVRWLASKRLIPEYRIATESGGSTGHNMIKRFNETFEEIIPLPGMNPHANIWKGPTFDNKPIGQAIMVPQQNEPIIITKTITSHVIQTKTAGQGIWSRSATVSRSAISGSSLAAAGGPLSHAKGPYISKK